MARSKPEIFKPVLDWGPYEVSSLGRVRGWRAVVLVPFVDKDGYYAVNLVNGTKRKRFTVHRLMCLTFLGLPEEGALACHWNDVKDDNRIENLYWGTPKTNNDDAIRNGRFSPVGELNPNARLKPQMIEEAKVLRKQGATWRSLGERYGVTLQAVRSAVIGKSWSHLSG